jgi:DNA-binding response OmpR family regulator
VSANHRSDAVNGGKMAFNIHGIDIDPTDGVASVEGEAISLTRTEFGMLNLLARNAGTAYTRQQIIEAIYGPSCPSTDRTVDVHMTALRKKLGTLASVIETVRGVGYRFRSSLDHPIVGENPADHDMTSIDS